MEDADLAGVGLQFALANDIVTKAATSAREASLYSCGQAATCLLCQVVQEEFVHHALQPDVNSVDRAFGQGLQRDAGVGEAFENAGEVLLVARKSVERLSHDVADFPALYGGEERA